MSDDETPGAAPDPHAPALLLYDFLKYLTTLSILVLGGVLSLNATSVKLPRTGLGLVIACVSVAATVSVMGADAIVQARLRGRAIGWRTRWTRNLALGLLGAGTGAFLSMWTQAIK